MSWSFLCANMFPYEDSKTVSVCLSVRLFVCLSVHLSVPREKKSPWLRQYQSHISNWYINERSSRVLHHENPKISFFFQKSSKFEFWLLTKSWNHLSFVNISPTLVIDTSMERSSRVLHHGNPKIGFFSSKKFEIRILTCDEELKSPYLRQYTSPTLVIDTSMERSSRVLHHGNPKIWFFHLKSSKFEFWLVTNSWNHLN